MTEDLINKILEEIGLERISRAESEDEPKGGTLIAGKTKE